MSITQPTGFRLLSEIEPQRGPTSLTVVWDRQVDAANYRLTLTGDGNNRTQTVAEPPIVFDGLRANLGYQLSLVAIDAAGVASLPALLKAATSLPKPSAPQAALSGLTAGAPVRVTWSVTGFDFDTTHAVTVSIVREPVGGARQLLMGDAPLVDEAWDHGVAGPIRYYIQMASHHPDAPNGLNESPLSESAEIAWTTFAGGFSALMPHALLGRLTGGRL